MPPRHFSKHTPALYGVLGALHRASNGLGARERPAATTGGIMFIPILLFAAAGALIGGGVSLWGPHAGRPPKRSSSRRPT